MELFGFHIGKKKGKKPSSEPKKVEGVSPIPPSSDDVVETITTVGGGRYVHTYNFDQTAELKGKKNADLIRNYRRAAQHPDVETAINDIVDESIVFEKRYPIFLEIYESNEHISKTLREKIFEEFKEVCSLLKVADRCDDYFKRWYIDGRIIFHKVVDPENLKKGVIDFRFIDPIKITRKREVIKKKQNNIEVVESVRDYFVYDESNDFYSHSSAPQQQIKIDTSSILYVPSGVYDIDRSRSVSHLHKSLREINQLRMMEDSLVIYRIARAPERRIFYIDTGNLSPKKEQEYVNKIMQKHRTKMVYDATSGEVKSAANNNFSMLEDYWLPRREGSRGTQIDTLPGGENLGRIEDIEYFQRKMLRSLNVPISRLDSQERFSFGRATDITREEYRFQKFIKRLRYQFSKIFIDALKTQLILKEIIDLDEWQDIREGIAVRYYNDSFFNELKEQEILQERMRILQDLGRDDLVGKYFSHTWVRKTLLKQSDEEIKELDKQIAAEKKDPRYKEDEDSGGGRW